MKYVRMVNVEMPAVEERSVLKAHTAMELDVLQMSVNQKNAMKVKSVYRGDAKTIHVKIYSVLLINNVGFLMEMERSLVHNAFKIGYILSQDQVVIMKLNQKRI